MNFPKLLILTDAPRMKPGFEAALLEACLGGAKWFCVREKSSGPREILEFFARASHIAEKFGAQTFLNGRADLARAVHADGLHLPEHEISPAMARLTLGFHTPIGVSVHDLEGARRAEVEGANYLLFGAVFPTQSHPGELPAGLEILQKMKENVNIPVFVVGGVNAFNAASCLAAGAAGIAVISGVWDAPNISQAVKDLRAALGETDAPHSHHAQHLAEHNHGDLAPAEVSEAHLKTGLAAALAQSGAASDIILENGNGGS
ncbi:thiamine-phosphate pyrophosphorylase [Abditibacterium utsteinense]|uniref:Thiamine-phosphate synthase n=1 Tax=Abditibacterium utsteinense TaxID=1960156 RepID=A0A2S8SXC5_9BACT|nr:thiamine phosphate synthase [Abditibacterium utsteinense]PQV65418.1 thiamine-phosphate pyrophosphorylase [Abditibacterium utsteinense]